MLEQKGLANSGGELYLYSFSVKSVGVVECFTLRLWCCKSVH